MNRYSSGLFSDLRRLTTKPFSNIKPLKLTLTQFYTFMVQRYLNKIIIPEIPRGSSKTLAIFDMLATEDNNPLSVYVRTNMIYLPDGNVTWSINEYEGN